MNVLFIEWIQYASSSLLDLIALLQKATVASFWSAALVALRTEQWTLSLGDVAIPMCCRSLSALLAVDFLYSYFWWLPSAHSSGPRVLNEFRRRKLCYNGVLSAANLSNLYHLRITVYIPRIYARFLKGQLWRCMIIFPVRNCGPYLYTYPIEWNVL